MPGRKIILLSDGTGNSASKITKTNVWRIYGAIDLSQGDQIAFYDDGVGSGGFKLFRYLGGALGYGLARNVRELYGHLCQHYSGPEDQIMLFGFSRGAFTARLLSGMIQHCGSIDRSADKTIGIWRWTKLGYEDVPVATDEGLQAAIKVAYRALRQRNDKAPVSRFFRWVRARVFFDTPSTEDFRKNYSTSPRPRIAFLGVFDTVSAYGLPIDEMSIAVHKWIWPLRFADMLLSSKVDHAYQALALDEARQSFHPMLWTERNFDPNGERGEPDERPQQAWFTGVHSDIGGGYGDERLSLVPACWMLDQAKACVGLRVRPAVTDDLTQRATALGAEHDSRQGFGAFYRYKPRILQLLGKEDLDGNGHIEVDIDRFKIHESVFERIKDTNADYAPIGIPADYDVVRKVTQGKKAGTYETVSATAAAIETADQRAHRATLLAQAEDLIFWRKVLYFIMTGIALALIVIPLLWLPNQAAISDGLTTTIARIFAWAITLVPLPKTDQIGMFWINHSYGFLALLGTSITAYFASSKQARSLQNCAQAAWAHMSNKPAATTSQGKTTWIKTWRSKTGTFHRIWTKQLFPALMVAALFIALPATAAWRWYLFTPFDQQSLCTHIHHDKPAAARKALGQQITFNTKDACLNTRTNLNAGRDYEISITVTSDWSDNGTYPADPSGLAWDKMSAGSRIFMAGTSLMRRFWTEDWFAMMGSIGRSREHAFRINAESLQSDPNKYVYKFHAWRSGRLYLFVNDAINPFDNDWLCLPKDYDKNAPWRCYYANNQGAAIIEINEIGER